MELLRKNVYASKLKLPVVFQKKKLKLCNCVWTFVTWRRAHESTLHFKIAYRNSWETAQSFKSFVTMPLWQSNNLDVILCYQSFLLHCHSLTCWNLLPFLESIWLFSYDFKNIEYLITSVNSNPVSRESLIVFLAVMVSSLTYWRAWPW